ncbi:PREDICTED: L-type lectin-domain containing receptor kinase IV.1-like [Brassica oleracea var. oleracea]|uniref:non-specific serine/threonine protein kinase n=1 Tax=Brassica oleracea var. oleracea TaxID=109376 RepID=A0A0D3ATG5_BRAOL|nr:PREDICTED: L-type lectin-domain containing receptor kinase IV.1-like [Brassica oleracea var. oleracea]
MFFKLLTIFFSSLLFQSLQSSSKTLNFIYDGFPQRSYISIQGIAAVTPNGLLRLTNTTVQQTGHAFYNKPIRLKNSPNGTVSSFSTTFVFAIHPRIPGLSGHGIAFVIAPNTRLPYATPSQYMGLFNITSNGNKTNHVFAIELDTIRSTEFNDINDNHVGIDINSLTSVKSSPAGWWDKKGQFNNLTLIGSKPMQVWIDYNGRTHKINVMMGPLNEEKPKKPLVSIVRDLSFVILQDMFVGFSSATGTVPAEHYVLGWSFGVNREAPPLDLSKLPKLPLLHPPRISYFCRFGIPSISIILIFSSIFLVCFIARRRRMFEEELDDWETELGKNRLRFKDLYYATKGFKEKDLLGSGGFGRVYKGVMLETNLEIAVKKVSHDSRQGLKEFVSEIVSIGRMSHPNLVPLLGYCRRRGELLLVYEYMPNGSLDKYLYNTPEVTLDWKQRSKVILDVASGLFYLHEDWEQVVIHRDVKASNVLLDGELNGRLGDFGLARSYDHGADPQTTNVVGTLGYLAPEHTRTGRATTATDVFAFGAFLLEVVCGRRPIEIQHESDEVFLLVDWVFRLWNRGNILDAVDPNIGSEYNEKEVEMILKIGLLCSHSDPRARPSMRQVLHYLRGDAKLSDLSPLDLSKSGMMFGVQDGFSELRMLYASSVCKRYTSGSSIADSLLSGGR